jgi:hypothetical protein
VGKCLSAERRILLFITKSAEQGNDKKVETPYHQGGKYIAKAVALPFFIDTEFSRFKFLINEKK